MHTEVADISPGNLDSSLCFIQPCISHAALCISWASLIAHLAKILPAAGDPGLIPGLGRSPGEGIGYPLQYYWASLVAQLVKNLPAMCKTWV